MLWEVDIYPATGQADRAGDVDARRAIDICSAEKIPGVAAYAISLSINARSANCAHAVSVDASETFHTVRANCVPNESTAKKIASCKNSLSAGARCQSKKRGVSNTRDANAGRPCARSAHARS